MPGLSNHEKVSLCDPESFRVQSQPAITVSGQNTVVIYITPLASIQHTAQKQNIVCDNQLIAQVTAGCNKQNVVFNNRLLELQPAVMLQFCNITAGCY